MKLVSVVTDWTENKELRVSQRGIVVLVVENLENACSAGVLKTTLRSVVLHGTQDETGLRSFYNEMRQKLDNV